MFVRLETALPKLKRLVQHQWQSWLIKLPGRSKPAMSWCLRNRIHRLHLAWLIWASTALFLSRYHLIHRQATHSRCRADRTPPDTEHPTSTPSCSLFWSRPRLTRLEVVPRLPMLASFLILIMLLLLWFLKVIGKENELYYKWFNWLKAYSIVYLKWVGAVSDG